MRRTWLVLGLAAAACGTPSAPTEADAAAIDAAAIDALEVDAAAIDALEVDALEVDAPPAGFGAVSGQCGVLTLAELDGTVPLWFGGAFDFDNRFDDPAERDQLTPGGQHIIAIPNAGGSSVLSEVFAFEWLARCEGATLLKAETEIVYDIDSKKVDILVEIDGRKVGVSVTRAMTFPIGDPYTLAAATTLFDRKLDDIQLATEAVSAADRWSKQMVVALAIDDQHAQVAMAAWQQLDAATRDDTILIVPVTNGDDLFLYVNM